MIFGASRMSQVDTALAAPGLTLSDEQIEALSAASPPGKLYPHWFDAMMRDEVFTKVLG